MAPRWHPRLSLRTFRPKRAIEHEQHRGRSAPDIALAVGNGVVVAANITDHAEVPLLIGGLQKKRKRNFEHVRDFDRVRLEHEWRLDPANDGRDTIAGDGLVLGELTEQRYTLTRQADLFFRFTQRSDGDIGILGFDAASREADLTRMIREICAALSEQYRQ